MHKSFDYIIVGAGSAGCAIAARLSEDPEIEVLLLEAGGPARRFDWRIHMPAAMAFPLRSSTLNWGYWTEPQSTLDGRRIPWARGRVMGGSSSINGMAFVRGHRRDFDGWAADPALAGWDYASVLPYFKRLETYDRGGNLYRGDKGPVHVQGGRGWNPLYGAFVEAAMQAGNVHTDDMNGFRQEGFGRMDMTVHAGRRVNTADAYLAEARRRPNLEITTGAHVGRLLFDGRRCEGVLYQVDGEEKRAFAEREVVLSAGAIGSPHLLMLSGVGAADELRAAGVTLHVDLPGVGRNLQDHLELFLQYACPKPITLQPVTRTLPRMLIGARWLLTRSGWGATNHFEAGGFMRSSDSVAWPDVQLHFLPRAIRYDGDRRAEVHGFQMNVATMRSKARGWLRLRSDRPDEHPVIEPRYMSEPEDWVDMRNGIRLTREIAAQAALQPYRGEELTPGRDVDDDRSLDAFIRAQATTGYHPCGACKMGSGPDAVVDGELRVYGVENLRVADSSIMPQITTGNLNAPAIMIGEKAADLLRERRLLPIRAPRPEDDDQPFEAIQSRVRTGAD